MDKSDESIGIISAVVGIAFIIYLWMQNKAPASSVSGSSGAPYQATPVAFANATASPSAGGTGAPNNTTVNFGPSNYGGITFGKIGGIHISNSFGGNSNAMFPFFGYAANNGYGGIGGGSLFGNFQAPSQTSPYQAATAPSGGSVGLQILGGNGIMQQVGG